MSGRLSANNLVGLFSPVQLGDPLLYFYNKATINLSGGLEVINLMDYFPLVKRGLSIARTLDRLMTVYIQYHKLLNADIADDLIFTAFNGNIPASKAYYQNPKISSPRTFRNKDEAESYGFNTSLHGDDPNTFQAILSAHPTFDPTQIKESFYPNFITLNSFILNVNNLNVDDINGLIEEYYLSKDLSDLYLLNRCDAATTLIKDVNCDVANINSTNKKQTNKKPANKKSAFCLPVLCSSASCLPNKHNNDVYEFIKLANAGKYNILDMLINDGRINILYASIILQDTDATSENLQYFDLSSDNYKAYFLAIETKNRNIIELVKNNIIHMKLQKQTLFIKEANDLTTDTNLRITIGSYAMRQVNFK